jgi:predicted O-methyltransferase YrrM
LIELVQALAPADVLEIGSYFGVTSRLIAEAIARAGSGSLTTIDPFGGDRLPGIMSAWPTALQAVTTFRAEFSMQYFASLEVQHAPLVRDARFNLVFVDGHHSYEYALFDIQSAAINLRPEGVIVADNVELDGVSNAVSDFLQRMTHWRLYRQAGQEGRFPMESVPGCSSAILLSPEGVEVGRNPVKFYLRDLADAAIDRIEIPLVPSSGPGLLTLRANLYSLPYDHHVTGVGLVSDVRAASMAVAAGQTALSIPIELRVIPAAPDAPIHLELELSFSRDGAANALVDVSRDIRLRRG